jgi:hypothetical protein
MRSVPRPFADSIRGQFFVIRGFSSLSYFARFFFVTAPTLNQSHSLGFILRRISVLVGHWPDCCHDEFGELFTNVR